MSKILRAMTTDGSAQIIMINSTDTVKEAVRIHHTSPTATAAFSRVLTAASLMGSTLKDKGNTLTLSIRGNGRNGHILAVADYMGNVKGYIENPELDSPRKPDGRIDVAGAIGKGTLNVVRDTGEKEPYVGVIDMPSGEIAEDITHYYGDSEQIPSVCALGEIITPEGGLEAAGGFLLMLLPMADDGVVKKIEDNVSKLDGMSALLAKGLSNKGIAELVLEGIPFDVFDEYEVGFSCDCSRERMGNALLTLNPVDLYNILVKDGAIEVGCQFCRKTFSFTGSDIEKIRIAKGLAKPRKNTGSTDEKAEKKED